MDLFRSWGTELLVRTFSGAIGGAIGLAAVLSSNACVATRTIASPSPNSRAAPTEDATTDLSEKVNRDELIAGLVLNWNDNGPGEANCATPRDFARQINSRLAGRNARWLASLLENRLQVIVAIQQVGLEWEGTLQLEGAVEAERTIVGAECNEVVTALALITALRLRELPTDVPAAEPSEENEPEKDSLVSSIALEAPANSGFDIIDGSDEEARFYTRVGVLGGHVSVPVSSVDLSVRADLRFDPSFSTWVWSGTLSYQQGARGRFKVKGAFAQMDLCSPSFSERLWVRACGFARGGAHHVVASETELGTTAPSVQPWLAFGVGVHADVPLRERLSVRPFVKAFASVSRNEYFVAGVGEDGVLAGENVASFRSSIFGVGLGVGLSYEL